MVTIVEIFGKCKACGREAILDEGRLCVTCFDRCFDQGGIAQVLAAIKRLDKPLKPIEPYPHDVRRISIKRREDGLCPSCGKERSGKTIYCASCLEIRNEARKRRQQARGKTGLCAYCGNERVDGKKLCDKCLAKAKHGNRRRYHQMVADGMCTMCRKVPAEPGRRKCKACTIIYQARRYKAHAATD